MHVQFSLKTANTALTRVYGQKWRRTKEKGQNKPGSTDASLLYRQRRNGVKGKADVRLMHLCSGGARYVCMCFRDDSRK